MAELKTKETTASVDKFLNSVTDKEKREDSFRIQELMMKTTKEKPKMWGSSIVGFGKYHYKYDSGNEGDMCITGFSPRKQTLTIYVMSGFEKYKELMLKLGKYKTGKSCLYIKKLKDVDIKTLKKIISSSYKYMKRKYN